MGTDTPREGGTQKRLKFLSEVKYNILCKHIERGCMQPDAI